MRKIVHFLRLPSSQRRTILVAWWYLLAFWIELRTRPYPKVASRAAIPLGKKSRVDIDTLAWCVGAAAGTHMVFVRCLERSLTLQRLLRRQGVHAQLRIGVRSTEGSIEAHAWIEVEGRPIAEPEEIGRSFAALETSPLPHDS